VAEAPARYCSNCGHELGDAAQFCPNCGSPVHRTAHVPTPEADVPVPPPPNQQQASGTQSFAPTGAAPRQHSLAGRLLVGCAGLVVLSFLFVGCLALLSSGGGGGGESAKKDVQSSAGDGKKEAEGPEAEPQQPEPQQEKPKAEKKPKPEPKFTVGQTAQAANVQWKVTDAFRTSQLKSTFGTQKRGKFVVIDFTFTNNRPEEVTLDPELHMILKDSQGREFGSDLDAWEFVPTALNIFLEPVNPGVSTNGRVVYEVAPDATGFTLTLDDVELMEDKSAVFDLRTLSSQAYDPSSASASASPAAGQ
jgi:hypothetical protein